MPNRSGLCMHRTKSMGESFTAQSAQGRLSSKSSLELKVLSEAARLFECDPNASSW
ncbi:hypothetical protein HanXRQr2_Chr04g0145191 [Helianthus annuus]|uniref:Uncharacterized protein n=1 Tax=Helianthus annuus TaxID=4232 RepID=A0A9K3J3Z3_HELAN|nr:hypothetical protein HanXRQr2_Chr04g0145191 [Helianthus annuus]KAJ0929665.1 hypothetical protein HanPSC8_Chr04g0140281 [Helianthus annuus]